MKVIGVSITKTFQNGYVVQSRIFIYVADDANSAALALVALGVIVLIFSSFSFDDS